MFGVDVIDVGYRSLLDHLSARARTPEGRQQRWLIGCSGGPDSTALALLARAAGIDMVIAHVIHDGVPAPRGSMQPSSDDPQSEHNRDGTCGVDGTDSGRVAVRRLARRLGVPMIETVVYVPPGASWESQARTVRRAALCRLAAGSRCHRVALAHHLDDQAETVMDRLLRGSGVSGVAAMAPVDGIWIRPLLGVRRATLASICDEAGVSVWNDPTNLEGINVRSWLRTEALPSMSRWLGRDVAVPLARFAQIARQENELLDGLARQLVDEATCERGLRVAPLRAAPDALAQRALRIWLGYPRPDQRAVMRMMTVVAGERVATEVSGYGRFARSGGVVSLVSDPKTR